MYRVSLCFIIATVAASMACANVILTFPSSGAISIPDVGTASPYPATLNISGVSGVVTDLNVTLSGFSHTFPSDLGILLVGPNQRAVMLMDGAGSFVPVSNATLTFDDQAAAVIPETTGITSGTYRPANYFNDVLTAPAPAGPYSTLLSVFNGAPLNGPWRLYVQDFSALDAGAITGGFSITANVPEPATHLLVLLALAITLAVGSRSRLSIGLTRHA